MWLPSWSGGSNRAEDENDALELRLAKIEDVLFGGERIPAAIVERLAGGEAPVRVANLPIGLLGTAVASYRCQ